MKTEETQNNKKPCLLIVGFNGDTNRKIEETLYKYNVSSVFKKTSGEAIKAIDLNKTNINGLLLNIKDLPSMDEKTDIKGADVIGFISGAAGLVEDALNKEIPVIIISNTDNYFTNMIGEVMLSHQDVEDNISRAKAEDVTTEEGLKTLLNTSIKTTSFGKRDWNLVNTDTSEISKDVEKDSSKIDQATSVR